MLSIVSIKNFMNSSFGRTGLVLQKNAPQIMLVTGVVGVVAGTVLDCKATLKFDDIKTRSIQKFMEMETAHAGLDKEVYSENDYQRDKAVLTIRTMADIGKLYFVPALVIAGSLSLIVGSHQILSRRNFALT